MKSLEDDSAPGSDNRVAIVEDDLSLREAIVSTLEIHDIPVIAFNSAELAWEQMLREPPRVVVTDIRLPGISGLELLKKTRRSFPDLPIIVMTAHADTTLAVDALRAGANDFLIKPFLPKHLLEVIRRYGSHIGGARPPVALTELIAVDPAMVACVERLRRVASTDASVLLTGESGVGKDVFARQLHALSTRHSRSLIAVNCAAIPDTLLESTLFGHERGAFTNASRAQPGKFEQADGGTLFLDEIGEMPLGLQAKLLRVLQDQVVERLGGGAPIKCNVRIISATNQKLKEKVQQGLFREDLFYRLNVFEIHIPALRTRPADIVPLTEFLIRRYAATMGKEGAALAPPTEDALRSYAWPGNVRELENAVQRALLMSDGLLIEPSDLEICPQPGPAVPEANKTDGSGMNIADKYISRAATGPAEHVDLATVERMHILSVLEQVNGNRRKAAQILGLSERGLRYKLREYESNKTTK